MKQERGIRETDSNARITVYEDDMFTGASLAFESNVDNFQDKWPEIDNAISSVRASKGDWVLYVDPKRGGTKMLVCEGSAIDMVFDNDMYSSMYTFTSTDGECKPVKLEMYDNENKEGGFITLTCAVGDVSRFEFNDMASLITATRGTWIVYANKDYVGTCLKVKEGQTFSRDELYNLSLNDEITSARPLRYDEDVRDTTCASKIDRKFGNQAEHSWGTVEAQLGHSWGTVGTQN